MEAININQVLIVYTWFPLALLLALLLLIARFYRKQTGERTYYVWFIAPIVLFGLASARYATLDQSIGDLAADLLMFTGGVALIALCALLYRQMMVGR